MFVEELAQYVENVSRELRTGDYSQVTYAFLEIGRQAVRDNFTSSSSPDNETWKPRKKEGDGHPLLMDTGRLIQAATGGGGGSVGEVGSSEVVIGVSLASVPYARAHNLGNPNRNLPQREFLGLTERRAVECEDELANYVQLIF